MIRDDIGEVLKWAEAFFAISQDDDDVSEEEQAQRDEGLAAIDRVTAWLNTPGTS